jgi:hypothetical protein
VTNEILDSADMIREFFGEGEGRTDQSRDALPYRIIETLEVIGFPGFLRDSSVLPCRNDPFRDGIWVRMDHCLCTGDRRHIGPELNGIQLSIRALIH